MIDNKRFDTDTLEKIFGCRMSYWLGLGEVRYAFFMLGQPCVITLEDGMNDMIIRFHGKDREAARDMATRYLKQWAEAEGLDVDVSNYNGDDNTLLLVATFYEK